LDTATHTRLARSKISEKNLAWDINFTLCPLLAGRVGNIPASYSDCLRFKSWHENRAAYLRFIASFLSLSGYILGSASIPVSTHILSDLPLANHSNTQGWPVRLASGTELRERTLATAFHYPFKDEAQTALFKDPVRTAL